MLISIIPLALAIEDKHYQIELNHDYINDQISANSLLVLSGAAPPPINQGSYKYELISFDNQILDSFNFIISANYNIVTLESRYFLNAKTISILDQNNNKKLEIDVSYFSDTCGNGFCEKHENSGSCPSDCQTGAKDGYCDKVSDWKCDPDCVIGEGDYDCEAKKTRVLSTVAIAAIIAALIAAVFYFKGRAKGGVSRKDELLELKNYLLANMQRGYPLNSLMNELLKDGWSRAQIDSAIATIKGRAEKPTKQDILSLETYIQQNTEKGFSEDQIKKELLKDGWKGEDISIAFNLIRKRLKIPTRQESLELRNYIINTMSKGYTKQQIKTVLMREGWPEKYLDNIFISLRIK